MKSVYKYNVSMWIPTTLEVPKKAKFIYAGFDLDDNFCVWALVNVNETKKEDRIIVPLPTGVMAEKELSHISTIVNKEQGYIFHIFEEIK